MAPGVRDAVHELWDELAEHPCSKPKAALDLLLGGLCALMQAQSAYCVGTLRRDAVSVRASPRRGWRAVFVHHFAAPPSRDAGLGEAVPAHIAPAAPGAGRFRVYRLGTAASPALSGGCGAERAGREDADTLCAACPVNGSAELCYAFSRAGAWQPFSDLEQATLHYALRSLKWFHRQLMLNHGLLVANKPPTPTERRVLNLMLAGWSEKRIAAALGQRPATTHQHIKALYRKFNVGSHAELIALWLGHD